MVIDPTDRALEWAGAGYYVYPVQLTTDDKGKKVVDFPGNWREKSTRDEEVIRVLFSGDHDGIAIDTGRSGIAVLDIDTTHGKDGLAALKAAGIDLPHTPMTATTWSGGFHGFFRMPEKPVGSGSNRPVTGVDWRGEGGVIFADPTPVYDGWKGDLLGRYAVDGPILPVESLPVLPESYASRLRAEPRERKSGPITKVPQFSTLRQDQTEAIEKFVEQDLDVIRHAVDGSRNESLGRTLFLADRYRKLGRSFEEFESDVLDAYHESGGEDDQQAEAWCASSWKRSAEDPMDVPRTKVDEMADSHHQRLVATRLARSRISGDSARFITGESFVDWSVQPAPPEFWVAGVLPKGEQIVLYGKPEAGKTFTGIDWGMSVSLGIPWFGRETESGRVWFLAGEGNARITARMHAWMEHHERKPDPGRFRLLNHVPDLMNETVIEQFAQRIAEDEVDLGFIDTLGRAMAIGGGDISSPPDAAQALKSLQHLSKYRPQFTPVVIHHPTKEGPMAGAYNLLAGVDVALFAEVGVDTPGMGTLRFEKNKDGAKTTIATYRWKPVGDSAVLVPAFGPAPETPGLPTDPPEDRRRREQHG